MINAITTALTEDAPNMLLTLLLISFLVIWLQSKFNREFGALRKEIAEGNTAIKDEITALRKDMTEGDAALREEIAEVDKGLREEIAKVDKGLRKEIGGISTRLARIEGKLEMPAYIPETEPRAQAG